MLSASSEATVRVDKATSHLLIGPDWTMNMEICDLINSSHWQAKDVVKSVKKRLQHKNPRVQFLALILLETMVKNCGDVVHFQVVNREIPQEMIKIVRKKTDMQVRDKVLSLLDSWQDAFGGPQGKYPQYYFAYAELKRTGVHFPQRSGDSAPIFMPPSTYPTPEHPSAGHGMPSNSSLRLDEAMASEMGNLSASELDSTRSAMELLDDMLQAVNTNDREAVKDEVIVDLISQCRTNQKRFLHFVSSTRDEVLLSQALEINDNLQYLIAKHDAIASGSPLPTKFSSLIPRSDGGPSTPEAKTVQDGDEEEDDGFTHIALRNSTIKPDQSQSSSAGGCDQDTSSNLNNETIATSTSKTEALSTSNALAWPDQSTPENVSMKDREQDLIDLLSITLSTNPSSPQTSLPSSVGGGASVPVTSLTDEHFQSLHPYASQQTHAYPDNPQQFFHCQTQERPHNPQSVPVNQCYMTYNNNIAAMAQQAQHRPMWQPWPQPQFQQASSYPPPPWTSSSGSYASNISSTTYPRFVSSDNVTSGYTPVAMNASRPLTKYNSFGSGTNTANETRPLQHQNSFGSRGNNVQVVAGVTQNVNQRAPGSASVNKPFVPSYRLFEDLIDLRSTDGGIKGASNVSSLSSSSNHSMNSGRK